MVARSQNVLIAMLTIRSNQITGGKGGSFEPIVDHAALAEILGPPEQVKPRQVAVSDPLVSETVIVIVPRAR